MARQIDTPPGSVRAEPQGVPHGHGLTWLLALVTGIGPFSMQLYLPALPVIQVDLGTTLSATQVTVSGYLLAMAFAMPLIGPLADQFGRRPVLIATLAIFAAGSVAGWLAPNIEWLIGSRIVQGAGGAGGLILARAIVSDIYGRRAMARVIAQLTMIMVLAPTVAPLLGGLITDWFGWRPMFLVQIAVSGLAIAAVFRWLPETLAERHPFRVGRLVTGFRTVLGRSKFVGYMLQGAFSITLFLSFISVVPYIMAANERPATEYGLYFLLLTLGYTIGNFVTSKTAERVDPDRLIVIGLSLSLVAAAFIPALAAIGILHPLAMFLPATAMVLGQGIANPNSHTGAVKQAPDFAGTASSTASFVQYIFAAVVTQLAVLLPHGSALGLGLTLVGMAAAALLTIFWTFTRDPGH